MFPIIFSFHSFPSKGSLKFTLVLLGIPILIAGIVLVVLMGKEVSFNQTLLATLQDDPKRQALALRIIDFSYKFQIVGYVLIGIGSAWIPVWVLIFSIVARRKGSTLKYELWN